MTDIPKPEDEYNLIGDHWPAESESSYDSDAAKATTLATKNADAADAARRSAEQAATDWEGQAGTTYTEAMHQKMVTFTKNSDEATRVAGQLTEAAGAVSGTKDDMVDTVNTYTPAIATAESDEKAGKKRPAGESSKDLIHAARQEIADTKSAYDTQMDTIEKNLQGGTSSQQNAGNGGVNEPKFTKASNTQQVTNASTTSAGSAATAAR
jgi:hypothetical protein